VTETDGSRVAGLSRAGDFVGYQEAKSSSVQSRLAVQRVALRRAISSRHRDLVVEGIEAAQFILAAARTRIGYSLMEYRGFEINVVQGINGGRWKWSVKLPTQRREGEARNRQLAIFAANKAVDRSLEPKPPKVKLSPRP
jgi:hypothetical protein